MSKLYLFGIGGTGSRVMRSLTMLMASGVELKGCSQVIPIIIDPDISNADLTRASHAMDLYAEIRSRLDYETNGNQNKFFKTDLSTDLLSDFILHINDTSDKKFKEFIDLSSMDKKAQALTQMLFSEKNLESDMNVGFKGNPNIGSVVLNQITYSEDFETVANSFEEGDRIFIISSIFGGTGASGFPLLLKTLRTGDNFSNNQLINNASIGAVSILPYFRLKVNDESEIDSSTFISKTKAALSYYEKNVVSNKSINTLYFLADTFTNVYDNNEGGEAQENEAHIVEFLAATAIIDFCKNENEGTECKEFGLEKLCNDEKVTFQNLSYDLNESVREPLIQFLLMANCLLDKKDFVTTEKLAANANGLEESFYHTNFCQNLMEFLFLYKGWLWELKDNKRSLDLFNLNCPDKPFELITDIFPKKKFLSFKKENYELFYSYLNKSARDCKTKKENFLLDMYYRATQKIIKDKFTF